MGFNQRRMARERAAAERAAARQRELGRDRVQAEKLVAVWNSRAARKARPSFYPTIETALLAGAPWLAYQCPGDVDLRTLDRHPIMMVRRDGAGVRLFTRRGYDWTDRFPAIVSAARSIRATSFLIDGEAVCCDGSGVPVFQMLRQRRNEPTVFLYAFEAPGVTADLCCASSRAVGLQCREGEGRRRRERAKPASCSSMGGIWPKLPQTFRCGEAPSKTARSKHLPALR
jgi:hypothetical protein